VEAPSPTRAAVPALDSQESTWPPASRVRRTIEGLKLFAVRVLNYLTNHIITHVPSYTVRHGWYRRVLGIRIGEGAAVHLGCYVWFYGPSQLRHDGLTIGARSLIHRDCCLDARGSLRIGENVSISPEVTMLTAFHPVDDPEFRVANQPIEIDDYAFIGTRAMILPGVRIGRGAVVGAGSVVTRDVPPLAIVAGVPARQVGTRPPEALEYTLTGARPLFE
jgi:acetyltransferase-like isoleucine patch superfamily enzyme